MKLHVTAVLCILCGFMQAFSPGDFQGVVMDKSDGLPWQQMHNFLQGCWMTWSKTRSALPRKDAAFDGPAIFIGDCAVKKGIVDPGDLKKAGADGFVLVVGAKNIGIAAQDPWALFAGVGRLAQMMGVRPAPGGKWTVVNPPVQLKETVMIECPDFHYRNGNDPLAMCFGMMMLADPRRGASPELFDPGKTGSDLWIDHTAGYLVPRLKFQKEHPEYYAMRENGKRIEEFSDHRTPLCLSNPDVKRISAERMLEWIKLNPDKRYFFVSQGDTVIWCRCPDCEKLDETPGKYSARLLHWVNHVADAVGKAAPNKTILTHAYAGANEPPLKIKPSPNVCVAYANGMGNYPFFAHSLKSGELDTQLKILKDWAAISKTAPGVDEYIGGCYQPAFIDQTADRYRKLKEAGADAIFFSYGSPTNFPAAFRYLHGRLLWNTKENPLAVVEEFADGYYSKAAEGVKAYFRTMSAQYRKTLGSKLKDRYPVDFYTRAYVENANRDLAEAAGLADSPILKKELSGERYLFLVDALTHLPNYNDSSFVDMILKEMAIAAADSGREKTYMRELGDAVRKIGNPEVEKMLQGRIGKVVAPMPQRDAKGIELPIGGWMNADFGPAVYGPAQSPASPPKFAVAVFQKAKGGRSESSSQMDCSFELSGEEAEKINQLLLEGQTGITKWASESHRKSKMESSMEISINDRTVYQGPFIFVMDNWSRQEIPIPAGILKAGNNMIVIRHTGKSRGPFAMNWLLLSRTKFNFKN